MTGYVLGRMYSIQTQSESSTSLFKPFQLLSRLNAIVKCSMNIRRLLTDGKDTIKASITQEKSRLADVQFSIDEEAIEGSCEDSCFLAPKAAEIGDILVHVYGGEAPFVVRKRSCSGWSLVGFALHKAWKEEYYISRFFWAALAASRERSVAKRNDTERGVRHLLSMVFLTVATNVLHAVQILLLTRRDCCSFWYSYTTPRHG